MQSNQHIKSFGWTLAELPALLPALGLICGIAIMAYGLPLWACLAIVVLAVIVGLIRKLPRLSLTALAALAGALVMYFALPKSIATGTSGTVTGSVTEVRDYGNIQQCVVKTSDGVNLLVSVADYPYYIEKGEQVRFKGVLLPPGRPQSVPDEITNSNFLLTRSISARCKADSFEVTAEASGVQGWFNRLHHRCVDVVDESGLSAPASQFLTAVLLGQNNIESDRRQELQRAGLAHITALSGTHISTIALIIAIMLLPMQMAGASRYASLFTIALLWGYALLTGMSPSVLRAVIMATFVLLGEISGKRGNTMNMLCVSVLLILLFAPTMLFSIGFQLSVLAVAGIVMFMSPLLDAIKRLRIYRYRLVRIILPLLSVPIAAMIATGPLAAWRFHYFPLWFLVANIPVSLILPWMLGGGVMMVLGGFIGFLPVWLTNIVEQMFRLIDFLAGFAVMLPGSEIGSGIYYPAWVMLLIYVGIFMLWRGWVWRSKVWLVNGIAVIVFSVALNFVAKVDYPQNEVYAMDESMEICLLERNGNHARIITDAHPRHYGEIRERAEVRLADYLGYRRAVIDTVMGFDDAVAKCGGSTTVGNRRIVIIRKLASAPKPVGQPDVIIISAGFNGSGDELTEYLNRENLMQAKPRIVLSPALPAQIRQRLATELSEAGIPYSLNLEL